MRTSRLRGGVDPVSGSRDFRHALDRLIRDAKRRKVDVLLCWSLDRLGQNLKHLVVLLDDRQALGVEVITLREGWDWTPSGKLKAQLFAIIAEFEKNRCKRARWRRDTDSNHDSVVQSHEKRDFAQLH